MWDVFANQSEFFDSFASHSLLSLGRSLESKAPEYIAAIKHIHTLQLRWNLLPNISLLLHLLKLFLQETAIYMHKRYLVSDGFSGFYWEFFEN